MNKTTQGGLSGDGEEKGKPNRGGLNILSALQDIFDRIPDDVREELLGQIAGPGAGAPFDVPPPQRSKRRKKSSDSREAARDLVEEAWEAQDPEEQVRLSLEALRRDKDCVEAHQLLGDLAPTAAEAAESYREAMQSAERRLGPEAFREYAGHFWGFVETRPYMTARERLAGALWAAGRRDEALQHYEGLLELNPGDNQGVRYVLATHYVESKRFDALQRLLDQYVDDDSAEMLYTRPLLTFRRRGDVPEAREQLRRAFDVNRYVPDYLLGDVRLPAEPPETITWGGKDEAVSYVFRARGAWTSVPEALAWLRETVDPWRGSRRKTRKAKPKAIRPTAADKRRLKALESDPTSVWQVAVRPLPETLQGFEVSGAWAAVVDRERGLPLAMLPADDDETRAAVCWKTLREAMLAPADEHPRRPGLVEFDDDALTAALQGALAELDVPVRTCAAMEAVDRLPERLAEFSPGGGLTTNPETTPTPTAEDLAELPQAADETWQVDQRRLPMWEKHGGRILRPSSVMIASNRLPVVGQSLEHEPTSLTGMWNVVARTMLRPVVGEGRRPAAIEVVDDEWARFFQARCEPLSIEVRVVRELSGIDAWMKEMERRGNAGGPPALSDAEGFTDVRGASFFEAAAAFYRAAPWKNIPADAVFRFTLPGAPKPTWFGVVMGQSGLERGLALYESLDDLRDLMSGRVRSSRDARRVTALSLMYGEAHDTAFGDLDRIERHAWPIAAPEAHPLVLRLKNGKPIAANLDELTIVEGALRLLTDERRRPGANPLRVTVSLGGEPTEFETAQLES